MPPQFSFGCLSPTRDVATQMVRPDRQVLLYETNGAGPGLLQKLRANLLLFWVVRVIFKLTLHVEEDEAHAVISDLRQFARSFVAFRGIERARNLILNQLAQIAFKFTV